MDFGVDRGYVCGWEVFGLAQWTRVVRTLWRKLPSVVFPSLPSAPLIMSAGLVL